MMAADTLGSYGSLARFKDIQRIQPFGESALVAAGGELSDFQEIQTMLKDIEVDDFCHDDNCSLLPSELYTYLTRVMYQRRNKFNPLWNHLVIGGFENGKPFLGTVDSIATAYTDDHVATGYGEHLARPLLRAGWRPNMREGEARHLLEECMRVLFYRDCRTINRIQIAKTTAQGTLVSPPFSLTTKWDYKSFKDPKAGVETGGSW